MTTMSPDTPKETRVVNRRTDDFDVYIGRGSTWGNPFKIGVEGTRQRVIELYRGWFSVRMEANLSFREETRKLAGKVLGCYCKPLPCHGDVIKEWLDEQFPIE